MNHNVFFALVIAASVGCSGSVDGTGDLRPPGGSETATAPDTASPGTVSGAPAEIEALFAPPTSEAVTPDTIFGVWASSGLSEEQRLKVSGDSLTLAKKCSDDPRIAYVTVGVRATDSKITILESKTTRLGYVDSAHRCTTSIQLTVGEVNRCTASQYYSCFSISDTTLTGLTIVNSGVGDWLKLSD